MSEHNQSQSLDLPPKSFSMKEPLRLLTETIEESNRFKAEMARRFKNFMESLGKLQQRLATAEAENRTLRAQVQNLQGENKQLTADNIGYQRAQQQVDAAIRMACSEFTETSQFIENATRMTFPAAAPLSGGAKAAGQQQPELTVVRTQTPSSYTQPSETEQAARSAAAPRHPVAVVPAAQAETSSIPASEVPTTEELDSMTQQIAQMLEQDFSVDAVSETPKVA